MPAATLVAQGKRALCRGIKAVNAKQLVGRNDNIGLDVPVPTTDVGQPLRFAKLNFPLTQRVLGMLALGDVGDAGDPAYYLAGGVGVRRVADVHVTRACASIRYFGFVDDVLTAQNPLDVGPDRLHRFRTHDLSHGPSHDLIKRLACNLRVSRVGGEVNPVTAASDQTYIGIV